ncbi:hypothetical protein COU95_00225 [Candidatus Shapirobacteria bacterium CG10_big_fil_rev_8_21_14_0_10_40_9]|uniref:Uncharacterized protein n=1 Tax=Candidatus Shapirobacteria bacterium CG10_big_fil_rev_8_21_14_0_10_40_9 TaxID=1974888 RepID=A0A2M8L4K4_9BACT|nr:MAG: hypothetical protein COU95_00225 [Candidatus Shapirobacteria bacterium CG10_big_fil_rev_8_21_14_0_10_40_9]
MVNKKRAVIFIVLVVVFGFLGWRTFGGKQQAQYQTSQVERGTIVSTISASGQILVANIVNITTSAKGLVKKVYVQDGDRVTLGQKILEMTLDSDAQQKSVSAYSSYLSAKNSLDSAQVSLYTLDSAMWAAQRKFINDAVSRSLTIDDPTYIQENDDWLAAEAKYKNQQNVIAQSQIGLSSAWLSYQTVSPIVYAPMSGIITNITYVEGMTISASDDTGQTVAVIKSEGTPLASFNISEIDVSKVKPGQKATIELDSIADKTFTGKILSVNRIGTVTSGVTNYPVVIKFDTEAPEILPNMAATANIIVETKDNVLLIPSSAIQRQGTQDVVRVLKGKKEQTVVVETGLVSDTQTEILEGLSEGDEVVVSTISQTSQQGGTSVFGGGGAGRMFMGR